MNGRMKMSKYLQALSDLVFYALAGVCLVLGLSWAGVTFAQSRLSVINVVVEKASATPRLSFAQPAVTLVAGDTVANPARSDQPGSNGVISYRSSDDAVVRVAADGTVTAVAAGAATITATQAADLPAFEAGAGSYQVTVVGPLSASANFTSRAWLVGEPVGGAVVPVSGSGGIGKLRYAIAPALPAGLDFSMDTGTLTGSASVQSPPTAYTVTVTDGATPPVSATATFNLAVGPALHVTVNRATWAAQAGDALNDTPVSAIGGIGTLNYAVTPELPAGLAMDAATGIITGTAAIASPLIEYTVTVTDSASPAHEVSSNFTLEIRGVLTAVPFSSERTRAAVGDKLSYLPVTAAGGVGALHYSVSPALPEGLKLDEATGALTGAAVAVAPLTTYTVTVTDSDTPAHTATASFIMEVDEMLLATRRVAVIYLMAEDPVTVTAPVNASGGTGTLHFEVSPALPPGLTLNASDGGISGSTVVDSAETVYTVTVSDSLAQRASATFSLRVFPKLRTSVFDASETHRVNDTVSYTPATTWGGLSPYRYTVKPALPAGLAMNERTGTITGVATAPSALTTYTYTAMDGTAHFATGTFSLLIEPELSATTVIPAVSVAVGATVNDTPVKAEGGLGLHHFSVQPALPAGLKMDEMSGTIKNIPGAPMELSPAKEYTFTVTDSANPVQTATATFTLKVDGGTSSGIIAVTINPQTAPLPTKESMKAYAPVTASDGVGALSYEVAPSLPAGLTMDRATGVISGTPTVEQLDNDAARYTVTITDSASPPNTAQGRFGLATFDRPIVRELEKSKVVMIGDTVNYKPVEGDAGEKPLTYRVLGGGLPRGLTMDEKTGVISGTALLQDHGNDYYVAVGGPLGQASGIYIRLEIAAPSDPSAPPNAAAANSAEEGDSFSRVTVTSTGAIGHTAAEAATVP